WRSVRQMPQTWTRTRTSPARGSGSGTSTSRSGAVAMLAWCSSVNALIVASAASYYVDREHGCGERNSEGAGGGLARRRSLVVVICGALLLHLRPEVRWPHSRSDQGVQRSTRLPS